MSSPTALVKLLDPLLQTARHYRIEQSTLIREAGLSQLPEDLPGARFPVSVFNRLLEQLATASQNPRIALRIGEATQPRMLGSIGFLMTTAATLQDAVEALIDYLPLLYEGAELSLQQDSDGLTVTLTTEQSDSMPVDWFMACLLNWPRWLTGQQVPALEVRLDRPTPPAATSYQQFFAAEVTFNAGANQLRIPVEYLNLPCQETNPEMHQLHREFADSLLSRSAMNQALIARTRHQIRRHLQQEDGAIRREQIAEALNMSLRTLQRKLGLLGTNFQQVYDQIRREQAIQLIQKGEASFGEISFQLGFANQSAFQKAFRRWLGTTPSEFRNQTKPATQKELISRPDTLAGKVPQSGMPLEQFYSLAIDLTEALQRLHHNGGRLHGLAPDTVTVPSAPQQVGLPSTALSTAQQRILYLRYQAPESVCPHLDYHDPRSDYFSLGLIFYYMLSGQHAFNQHLLAELLQARQNVQLRSLAQLRSELPASLITITGHLLQRSPDDRYQSSHGILHGLNVSRTYWRQGKFDQDLLADHKDQPERSHLPANLFGRDTELKQLLQYQRLSLHQAQLLLIEGDSGSGKSVLVRQLYTPLLSQQGFMLEGIATAQNKNTPYSAIAMAFQQFCQLIQLADAQTQKRWREKLSTLNEDLSFIQPLVPEIDQLAKVPELQQTLSIREHASRLENAFVRLIQQLSPHPIALVLENCQWLDIASAKLVARLKQDARTSGLLLACTYLPNAKGQTSPSEALRLLQTQSNETLQLKSLSADDCEKFVSATTRQQGPEVRALTAMLQRRSGGNPFALRQILSQLLQQDQLDFDYLQQQTSINDDETQAFPSQDIDTLLAEQIVLLPEITRALIQWATLLNQQWSLDELAELVDEPVARVAIHLWPAVQADLLLQEQQAYRFRHEQIRQSVYRHMPLRERQQMHASFGWKLLAIDDEHKQQLAMQHLSRADAKQFTVEQQLLFAENALTAATKARSRGMFSAARELLERVLRASIGTPVLKAELQLELLHARLMQGDIEAAQLSAAELTPIKLDTQLEIRFLQLKAGIFRQQGEHELACQLLQQALKHCGSPLPEDPQLQRLMLADQLLASAIKLEQQSQPVESAVDPNAAQRELLLRQLILSAWQMNDELLAACAITQMLQQQLAGKTTENAFAMMAASYLYSWVSAQIPLSRQLAETALKEADNSTRLELKASVNLVFGSRVQHWQQPLNQCLMVLQSCRRDAQEAGFWFAAAEAEQQYRVIRIFNGASLTTLTRPLRDTEHRCHAYQAASRLVTTLRTSSTSQTVNNAWDASAVMIAAMHRTELTDHIELLQWEDRMETALAGHYMLSEALLACCLSRIDICRNNPSQQLKWRSGIDSLQTRFEQWSRYCAGNFAPMLHLVNAEIDRLNQDTQSAMTSYERALATSDEGNSVHLQALIRMRYGQFCRQHQQYLANLLTDEARQRYRLWGFELPNTTDK